MALSSTEPLVARILMCVIWYFVLNNNVGNCRSHPRAPHRRATALVPNPSLAINSNESKSKHATDRRGVSAVTSSRGDTVGGLLEQVDGDGGSNGSGKNAGLSSSVEALDRHAHAPDSSEGTPTECSPVEDFNNDEEVFTRAKSARTELHERAGRPGWAQRASPPKEAPSAAAGVMSGKDSTPAFGQRVCVFWDGENAWYEGVVDHVDDVNALMYVVYDDGDEAWETYRNGLWSRVAEEGEREKEAENVRVEPARATSLVQPKTLAATTAERKRKALAGVDEEPRAQIGRSLAIKTPRNTKSDVVSGGAGAPADNTPNGASLPSASAPKLQAKRNKRLRALIGSHRRHSDVESPQPGNVANHPRRATEAAKDTPDSGPGKLGTEKGPVAKTAMARRIEIVSGPPVVVSKPPATTPSAVAPAGAKGGASMPGPNPTPKPSHKSDLRPVSRAVKRPITLGDMHNLSSHPSDDEDDPVNHKQNDVSFTARDAGDDADIFALDALNEAIVRAVDSQSTLANKISHQKLSLLKLEMKHALEEAHSNAKNKLSEVTHTSRVNCTNAINTLDSKISEMEMFMQQQKVTFNSMQQQCQALRKTAEHTIESSERDIHSLHDAEMGSLDKLHKALYDTYTDGVTYIKNYSERMTVGGPGKVRITV